VANLPIEEIEKMVGSRYALTVLAGKRARDLREGAPQLVNSDSTNPILVALQEIYEGKVVADNLDLSAGVEARQALVQAEVARAARELYASTIPAPRPTLPEVPLSILDIPKSELADEAAGENVDEVPAGLASAIIGDDAEIEDEDLVDPEEFAELDGNIQPTEPIDPTEE
jgi:DNA-directed RNA polymerase subunit omega